MRPTHYDAIGNKGVIGGGGGSSLGFDMYSYSITIEFFTYFFFKFYHVLQCFYKSIAAHGKISLKILIA